MSQAVPAPFENRFNFLAPDSGPHKHPYTCSFHWFRTSDQQLIGVDLVRSDDMGRRALRVYVIPPGRDMLTIVLEGPSSEWAPFATDAPPALNQDRPVLGRGENWVAASASAPGQGIHSVMFELHLNVLVPGKGTGEAGLLLAHMNAMDYLGMEVSGWIEVNGSRTLVDRASGYASIHFGDFLPDYAGIATVPPHIPEGAGILVNVTDSDDVKHGAALLKGKSVVYGFGSGKIPAFLMTLDTLAKGAVPLGKGARLELANIKGFPHTLLDRPTNTAVADATYVAGEEKVPLGQVILDFRGRDYASLLA
jgi:hypothetical protein